MSATPAFDPSMTLLGIAPTLWWNDDFPLLDIGISFEQCISEIALAGFQGCSIGHKYPDDCRCAAAALPVGSPPHLIPGR